MYIKAWLYIPKTPPTPRYGVARFIHHWGGGGGGFPPFINKTLKTTSKRKKIPYPVFETPA